MDNTAAHPHPFSADRPIEARSEDRLGRADFAEALARAIGAWPERDSLVVGLYGGWGTGKTSIKNMALESLCKSSPNVVRVEFNPWEWSGQNRLFDAFLQEIGNAVGRPSKTRSGRLRRWAAKLKEYGAYLQVGATLADGLRKFVAASLFLTTCLLPAIYFLISDSVIRLSVASLMLLGVSAFLRLGGRLANQVAEATLISAQNKNKTAHKLKNELKRDLINTDKSILVIIDDIDRLSADQILSIFQLVKAKADFPGIVYLLISERIPVDAALQASRQVTPDFIEKIVQIGFDVPIAEKSRVEGILFDELDTFLTACRASADFEEERWSNLFIEGLRPYLRRYAKSNATSQH